MKKHSLILAGVLAAGPTLSGAQDAPAAAPAPAAAAVELKEGDVAPAFSLPGTDGKTHSNADYKGKTIVLAWFPKAFTGG